MASFPSQVWRENSSTQEIDISSFYHIVSAMVSVAATSSAASSQLRHDTLVGLAEHGDEMDEEND